MTKIKISRSHVLHILAAGFIAFLIVLGINVPKTSAMTVNCGSSNACNANCAAPNDTYYETSSSYIDYIFRSSIVSWDDYVTWGATVNGGLVMNGSYGTASCGGGGSGSGVIDSGDMYFMSPLFTDADTVVTTMSAYQKRTSDVNPYGGTVNFQVHFKACNAGEITSVNICQQVTGKIFADLQSSGCTGSCPINITFLAPFGGGAPSWNNRIEIYETGANFFQTMYGLIGFTVTPALPPGTYNFCVKGYDGYHNDTGNLDCKSVTVPVGGPKTATMALSQTSFDLSSGNTSGSATISNINAANGGSFSVTGCTWVSGALPASAVSVNCPIGQDIALNSPKSFSVAIVGSPSAGSATYSFQAAGNSGTSVTSAVQSVTVSYSSTPVNGTCGIINGGSYSSMPSSNLCGTGTPSSVTGSGPWNWTCNGANNGANASCSANKAPGISLSISASPGTVDQGQSSSLFATVDNNAAYSSCLIGKWDGSRITDVLYVFSPGYSGGAGVLSTGALSANTTYRVVCPPYSFPYDYAQTTVSVNAPPSASFNPILFAAVSGTAPFNSPPWTIGNTEYTPYESIKSIKANAPLNGIDLRLNNLSGSGTTLADYGFSLDQVEFKCTATSTPISMSSPAQYEHNPVFDICNYPYPGRYQASARLYISGPGANDWYPTNSVNIIVTDPNLPPDPPPNDFKVEAGWTIPSGTPRYLAGYDYNSDSSLNKADQSILSGVVGGAACPVGKTCDLNSSGTVNATDVGAYSTYLQTLDMYPGMGSKSASVIVAILTGDDELVNALLPGAPSGSYLLPSSALTVPALGGISATLVVPSSPPLGTYNIVPTMTAPVTGISHTYPLTLNVISVPVCPAGTVNLSSTSVYVGSAVTASAPAGFSGGTFSSNNSNATVSGSTVTGQVAGTSDISGAGWTYSNGATSCALSARTLTVSTPPPVPGSCGSRSQLYSVGTTAYGVGETYCSNGTPTASPAFPPPGGVVSWICNGINTGANSGLCTASVPASQFSITIFPTPSGGTVRSDNSAINCGTICSASFPQNSVVTLRATPASSVWKFVGWKDGNGNPLSSCPGTSSSCNVTVDTAKTVGATFGPQGIIYTDF